MLTVYSIWEKLQKLVQMKWNGFFNHTFLPYRIYQCKVPLPSDVVAAIFLREEDFTKGGGLYHGRGTLPCEGDFKFFGQNFENLGTHF